MTKTIEKILAGMRASPRSVKFSDAMKVAEFCFGAPRKSGSHRIFKMPWQGDPRINLQDDNGRAKPYQVHQLLAAIDRKALLHNQTAEAETKRKDRNKDNG